MFNVGCLKHMTAPFFSSTLMYSGACSVSRTVTFNNSSILVCLLNDIDWLLVLGKVLAYIRLVHIAVVRWQDELLDFIFHIGAESFFVQFNLVLHIWAIDWVEVAVIYIKCQSQGLVVCFIPC